MEAAKWYCVRSRQKQEHMAAANLRQSGLEVFNPRLRVRRATQRGPVWFVEAVFPSYLFARFVLAERLKEVQSASGVASVVHFGERFPAVPAEVMADLRETMGGEEILAQPDNLNPEREVRVASGAFQGLVGVVKQVLPASQRVKILLDVLGRQTDVEIDSALLVNADAGAWKREALGKRV